MHYGWAQALGFLILRVTLGITVLLHGVNKVLVGVEPIKAMLQDVGFPGFFAYGAYVGEVVGPILLIIGWYARTGAALIVINMLFALGLAHRHELFDLTAMGGWAIELQAMYLFTALALVFTGPGRYSLSARHRDVQNSNRDTT